MLQHMRIPTLFLFRLLTVLVLVLLGSTTYGQGEDGQGEERAFLAVADRSLAVRDAIVDEVPGINDATNVTKAHLAKITVLDVSWAGLPVNSLKVGDFDGLTSLERLLIRGTDLDALPEGIFEGLTALTDLVLHTNKLDSLPEGVFKGLSSVEMIALDNNKLTSLPEGIFNGLPKLARLYLYNNKLTSLPADIFDGLPLAVLYLYNNELTSLPEGIFDGLSKMMMLFLDNNKLSALPAGVFEGLSALYTVWLHDNTVDPIPLSVSLEKVSDGQFKAKMIHGAPSAVKIPISVTNGEVSGGATELTIPGGSVESSVLTVTRELGTTAAVTVDIGTLPSIKFLDRGYTFAKAAALPITVFDAILGSPAVHQGTQAVTGSSLIVGLVSEQLTQAWIPETTALLANYPNPFNPETWIPYQLAVDSEVTVSIYATDGNVVRTLALGHQAAGVYKSRSRAAYWNGKNDLGERVGSGVYFYTLTAGDFSATRKLLILK